ncbi:MAG: CHAT domain-containing protein [Spirulinaceae cyanobacterium RM2_2_10]|nr:CHAT domain-containing protein [Spirulinaceae cyanobacterium RM2_2_10]
MANFGIYGRSRQLLLAIGQQLAGTSDTTVKIQALHSYGNALRASGDLVGSQDILRQGLELAEALNAVNQLSPLLLSLGNTAADRQNTIDARYYFEQAERTATNTEARLDAQLNRLRLAAERGDRAALTQLAPQIQQQLAQLPPSRPTVYAAVNLASTLDASPSVLPPQTLAQTLARAVQAARELGDATAEAYALEQLGQLYVDQGQTGEGIELLQQSLTLGRTLQAEPIVSQSAWSLGRSLKQAGRNQAAIAAYREAINALQALRSDLVGINQEVQLSFRESVEPVYRQLVGLLLDSDPDQAALAEVRELIEALQLAELDDFFRDACLDAQPRQIDEIDTRAAVLYSILLSDRLAVIVSAAGQPLSYYAVSVPQIQAEQTFRSFLAAIHPASDNTEQLRLAQQVYDWLIRPAATAGALQGRETLVFVLDGILQRLPVAALHDGQQYLIENMPSPSHPDCASCRRRR